MKNSFKEENFKNSHKGGEVNGKSHLEGGEDFKIKGTNEKRELEDGELVLTKGVSSDTNEYTITGTPREIASELNEMHGGVSLKNPNDMNILEKGGKIESFTSYANMEIAEFLKENLGSHLDKDLRFNYKGMSYTVEPLIHSEKGGKNKILTASYTIYNDKNKEVGTIDYVQENDNLRFSANSSLFGWDNEKFANGGEISASKNILWEYLGDTAYKIEPSNNNKSLFIVELQDNATIDEVTEKLDSIRDIEITKGIFIKKPFESYGISADESLKRGRPTLLVKSNFNELESEDDKMGKGGEIKGFKYKVSDEGMFKGVEYEILAISKKHDKYVLGGIGDIFGESPIINVPKKELEDNFTPFMAKGGEIKEKYWAYLWTNPRHKSGWDFDTKEEAEEYVAKRKKIEPTLKSEIIKEMANGGEISDMPKDSTEYLIDKHLKPLIDKVRNKAIQPDYRSKYSDYQILGLIVSKFARWDAEHISTVCGDAMEDANFHDKAKEIRSWYADEEEPKEPNKKKTKREGKIPMKSITIDWAEGDIEYSKQFPKKYTTWESANDAIIPIYNDFANSEYKGGYNKVRFTIIFDDGNKYEGTLYVSMKKDIPMFNGNVLGKHIKSWYDYLLSEESGSSENDKKEVKELLNKYDLGLDNDSKKIGELKEPNKKKAKREGRKGTFTSNKVTYSTKIFNSDKSANDFMEKNPEYGVIGENTDGVHIAKLPETKSKPTTFHDKLIASADNGAKGVSDFLTEYAKSKGDMAMLDALDRSVAKLGIDMSKYESKPIDVLEKAIYDKIKGSQAHKEAPKEKPKKKDKEAPKNEEPTIEHPIDSSIVEKLDKIKADFKDKKIRRYTADENIEEIWNSVVKDPKNKLSAFISANSSLPDIIKFPINTAIFESSIEEKEAFFEKIDGSIYDYIPVKLKKVKKIKPVNWKADPKDKGLADIINPFTSKDALRPSMKGIYFDDNGITATDAHKLLFLKADGGARGLFCMSKECWANNNGKDVLDEKFPNYEAVIPKDNDVVRTIDIKPLREFLISVKKAKLTSDITNAISIRLKDKGEVKEYGFNSVFLLDGLNAMSKLGHTEVDMSFNESNKRATLITAVGESKKASNLNADLTLIMPAMLSDEYSDMSIMSYDVETQKAV